MRVTVDSALTITPATCKHGGGFKRIIILKTERVLNQLKEQYDSAARVSDDGAKQAAVREEAHCLAEAVHALRALASSETRKTLSQFHQNSQGIYFFLLCLMCALVTKIIRTLGRRVLLRSYRGPIQSVAVFFCDPMKL